MSLAITSTVISVFGAVKQGQAQAAAADAQAAQVAASAAAANWNADLAEQNAQTTKYQKVAASDVIDRSNMRTQGSVIANYGASGVSGDNGSPLDVLADVTRLGALDKLTSDYNYDLKIKSYQDQATLDRMNAANGMIAATTVASSAGQYSTAGTLNAVGAGLNGYANYMKMSGQTIPSFSTVFGGS